MTTLTIRISEAEATYLKTLTQNKALFKTSKDISLGKTLKALLTWCEQNNFNPNEPIKDADPSRKLIEQLHVSIPHILYLLRLHILLDSNKMPDELINHAKRQAIDYINTVCGDFQTTTYTEIETHLNQEGLNQLPIDSDQTTWKVKK